MRQTRAQRGVTAVIVGLVLGVLGAFMAASLNIGQLMWSRNQQQNAVDSGALAGAMAFNGKLSGVNDAITFAEQYTQKHLSGTNAVDIDLTDDIRVGKWTRRTGFVEMLPGTDSEARDVNAIWVRTKREDNQLPLFFGGFLRGAGGDETTVSVGAHAVAIGGGPCEGCVFPIALPWCQIADPVTDQLRCNRNWSFSSDGEDTAGFTSLSQDSTNTNTVKDILNGGGCRDVEFGDMINISNGNNLVPLEAAFRPYIGMDVTVPVIDADRSGGDCTPKFNQDNEVVAFATMRVLEVDAHANPKTITIEFICNQDDSGRDLDRGGCGRHFGSTAPQVSLVNPEPEAD